MTIWSTQKLDPSPDVAAALAALRDRYAGTGAAALLDEVVYAIPTPAHDAMARSRLFDRPRSDAERDFAGFCAAKSAVGVRGDTLVNFGPLTTARSVVDATMAARLGWTARHLSAWENAADLAVKSGERLLGVAGRIVTEPLFVAESAALRSEYANLAAADRPSWPLRRPVRGLGVGPADRAAGPALCDLAGHLEAHLDRWGLVSLADWDLPEPQGPLLPSTLPAGAAAEPAHGVRVIVPLHYPLRGDDDLLRHVQELQKEAVKGLGLPASLAGVANHGQFAQLFRLVRLEAALRSRWPDELPRGAVGLIEGAAADLLGVGAESVRRMRKQVARLRRGSITSLARPR